MWTGDPICNKKTAGTISCLTGWFRGLGMVTVKTASTLSIAAFKVTSPHQCLGSLLRFAYCCCNINSFDFDFKMHMTIWGVLLLWQVVESAPLCWGHFLLILVAEFCLLDPVFSTKTRHCWNYNCVVKCRKHAVLQCKLSSHPIY